MAPHERRFRWALWSWWLAATLVGFLIAGPVGHFPGGENFGLGGSASESWQVAAALGGFFIGAIFALPVGGLHWLVLRRYVRNARSWALATVLGIGVAHGILDSAPLAIAYFAPLAAGAVVGVSQMLAFRPGLGRALIWVATSAVAWLIGLVLGAAVVAVLGIEEAAWPLRRAVVAVVIGAVWASATGIQLARPRHMPHVIRAGVGRRQRAEVRSLLMRNQPAASSRTAITAKSGMSVCGVPPRSRPMMCETA